MTDEYEEKNQDVPDDDDLSLPERAKDCFLYRICFQICTHDYFDPFMTAAIAGNSIVLGMDRYPITIDDATQLENVNEVFSFIFLFEMIIKLLGLGPNKYAKDSFNIFDGVVVIISCIELIIKYAGVPTTGGAFSGLRAVRLLRIFKLAKSWKSFAKLLQDILKTLGEIQYFGVLLVLFMSIFTLLGMELFGYKVKFNDEDGSKVVAPD